MATIVNNPPVTTNTDSTNSSLGILVGVILLAVLLFALYSLGVFRGGAVSQPTTQTESAPQINVPDKIDVNVQ